MRRPSHLPVRSRMIRSRVHARRGYNFPQSACADGTGQYFVEDLSWLDRNSMTWHDANYYGIRLTPSQIEGYNPVDKIEAYAVIIRAIHERGPTQEEALDELKRRGLWLSEEQAQQAGVSRERAGLGRKS